MVGSQASSPIRSLSHVTLFIRDQSAALEWYRETLGFVVVDDDPFTMEEGIEGRWLTIAPPDNEEISIALVAPDEDLYDTDVLQELESRVGTDPWWTFEVEDIEATINSLEEHDVEFVGDLRAMPWGRFQMISDPDGNILNLHEPPAR